MTRIIWEAVADSLFWLSRDGNPLHLLTHLEAPFACLVGSFHIDLKVRWNTTLLLLQSNDINRRGPSKSVQI